MNNTQELKNKLFNRCKNHGLTPFFIDGYISYEEKYKLNPDREEFLPIKELTTNERVYISFCGKKLERVNGNVNGEFYSDKWREKDSHSDRTYSDSTTVGVYNQNGVLIIEMRNGDLLTNLNFSEQWRGHLWEQKRLEMSSLILSCVHESKGSLSYRNTKNLLDVLQQEKKIDQLSDYCQYFDNGILHHVASSISNMCDNMKINNIDDMINKLDSAIELIAQSFESALYQRVLDEYNMFAKRFQTTDKPIYLLRFEEIPQNSIPVLSDTLISQKCRFNVNGHSSYLDCGDRADNIVVTGVELHNENAEPKTYEFDNQVLLYENIVAGVYNIQQEVCLEFNDCIITTVDFEKEIDRLSRIVEPTIDIDGQEQIEIEK